MELHKSSPSSIPIWVNLHNVPLTLWHEDGFAFLASHIGKPLYLDEATKLGNKLSYARVCINIEATTTVPKSFKVQAENCAPQEIKVEIPWQPLKCLHCKAYGHSDSNCSLKTQEGKMEGKMKSAVKRKMVWKEVVPLIKKSSNTPTLPTATTDSSPIVLPLDANAEEKKVYLDTSPPIDAMSPLSSPGTSVEKRVHFTKVELLLDKVNLAKGEALSTISFPALKSCLKVTTGGEAKRVVDKPP